MSLKTKITAILIFSFACFSMSVHAWTLDKVGTFQFEKLTDQVYVMHGPLGEPSKENQGFMNNPAIVLSDNGVIVIDPGSTLGVGLNVLREIKKITSKPVLAVFNTHIHGDHWLGNQAIKARYPKVKIYGHPDMIKQANGSLGLEWLDRMSRMTSGLSDDTKIVAPELAVKHTNSIEVDGQQFVIHSLVPAHTNTDIMIEHKQSRTLFLGDNLFNGRLGRFDNSASILGNIKALEYALELEIDHHVPGHGQSGKVEVTQQYLDYLKQLQASVQEGFDNDMEDFEIKEEAFPKFGKYQNWVQFDDNFGRHVNSMYLEIEKSAW